MITSINQLDLNKQYTYEDYLSWKIQERVELLKGYLFPMAGPNVAHQRISHNLDGHFWYHFQNHSCDVFTAPFDVRLPLPKHRIKEDKINTVVQPDLCVVCDESKLDKNGCLGAPDLVVEILSPGNSRREMRDKYELYEQAGVLEYWIIEPEKRFVLRHNLGQDGKFIILPYLMDNDILRSSVLKVWRLI